MAFDLRRLAFLTTIVTFASIGAATAQSIEETADFIERYGSALSKDAQSDSLGLRYSTRVSYSKISPLACKIQISVASENGGASWTSSNVFPTTDIDAISIRQGCENAKYEAACGVHLIMKPGRELQSVSRASAVSVKRHFARLQLPVPSAYSCDDVTCTRTEMRYSAFMKAAPPAATNGIRLKQALEHLIKLCGQKKEPF